MLVHAPTGMYRLFRTNPSETMVPNSYRSGLNSGPCQTNYSLLFDREFRVFLLCIIRLLNHLFFFIVQLNPS